MGTTLHPGVVAVVEDQEAFVAPAVRAAHRVLEVGCGRGLLAARLADAGHEVVAIDLALAEPPPARPGLAFVEADVRTFSAPRFDAIAFTASLHHVAPLAEVLDRADALLAPGGLLVIDDFDLDAPDLATLRWYFDAQDLLTAAGIYDPARVDGRPEDEPHHRWRSAHEPHDGEPPLHTGEAMLAAIDARFASPRIARGPYLWRRIARAAQGDHAGAIASAIHAAEERGVFAGTLRPTGLRVTARKPA